MSEDIFLLKLVTGEEIIGKTEESETMFFVKKPIQVFQFPDKESGKMKMGIGEFMPHVENTNIMVLKTAIAVVAVPRDEMIQQYKEITSDIILPDSKIQLA
jgi:hypothetical protein